MKLPSRFGLLAQLLTGFAAGGVIVACLLVVGDNMLERSSQRLVTMLDQHVRPLARLHHFQSELAAMRNLELELANVHDVFAVQAHVAKMRSEGDNLDLELRDFAARLGERTPADGGRLLHHWQEYRSRVAEQMRLAEAMDLAAAGRVTTSGSRLPFDAMQALLSELADHTEIAAAEAYLETAGQQTVERRQFLLLVLLGTAVMVVGLALSGRIVVRRIRVLHGHAQQLAEGKDSGYVRISRYDEIGDLAAAFTRMREQVLSRELALRRAQLELEDRVQARTQDLRRANRRLILFSQTIEQNPVGILIAGIEGKVQYANAAYQRITGEPIGGLVGAHISETLGGGEPIDIDGAILMAVEGERGWETERQSQRADGSLYWERLHLASVQDENGVAAHLLLSREDITERHEQQEKIAYQAHYDPLTGLPNRVLAHDRLLHAMGHSRREGTRAAAMYIDLDNFKQVNDTLGHTTGDGLLRQAAARLQAAMREEDTVARLGGDEFLIILNGLAHGDDTSAVAEKIIAAFAAPFPVDDRELVTSPSIGIAIYPDDGSDATELLRNADLAMYEAKEAGRNTYRFFDRKMNADAVERLNLLGKLRGAGDRHELVLHFQPQIDLHTGTVIGCEALLRWFHPEMGLVAPGRFIPIAEDSGLIVAIGNWVLREACRQAVAWQRAGLPPLVMAVNLSAVQFRHPDIYDTVVSALAETGLHPSCLELEITESILIRDTESVLEKATRLKELGLKLSIDDFGTGYSSLSYLKRFPVDKLKVDRSFVQDMATDSEDAALVQAIVQMAKTLGLKTIAEGVEDLPVLEKLRACHCDEVQGFLFGRPMPADDFQAYLERRAYRITEQMTATLLS
ncbi:MAG TPA: EAL domain-containing protein [Rhodocyclaceae bacterium]|nr:EAL domain-containing protein [Rhodocyclaceae bacterium]